MSVVATGPPAFYYEVAMTLLRGTCCKRAPAPYQHVQSAAGVPLKGPRESSSQSAAGAVAALSTAASDAMNPLFGVDRGSKVLGSRKG